jgi:hypothetical protein
MTRLDMNLNKKGKKPFTFISADFLSVLCSRGNDLR